MTSSSFGHTGKIPLLKLTDNTMQCLTATQQLLTGKLNIVQKLQNQHNVLQLNGFKRRCHQNCWQYTHHTYYKGKHWELENINTPVHKGTTDTNQRARLEPINMQQKVNIIRFLNHRQIWSSGLSSMTLLAKLSIVCKLAHHWPYTKLSFFFDC